MDITVKLPSEHFNTCQLEINLEDVIIKDQELPEFNVESVYIILGGEKHELCNISGEDIEELVDDWNEMVAQSYNDQIRDDQADARARRSMNMRKFITVYNR